MEFNCLSIEESDQINTPRHLLSMVALPEEISTQIKPASERSSKDDMVIAKRMLLFVIRQHRMAMKQGTMTL